MNHKLVFTERILGEHGTEMLINGAITQTIRGMGYGEEFLDMKGRVVDVMVRNGGMVNRRFLYCAKITSITKINLGSLTVHDAIIGGFRSLDELKLALKRANFRFKPLGEYNAYAIQFKQVAKN